MTRYHHSKSGLFLLELIINLLLFCVLCGCGLTFFMKSNHMAKNATSLHHAVRIVSSVAGIYETGDGGLTTLEHIYPEASLDGKDMTIYFNSNYQSCSPGSAVYTVTAKLSDTVCDRLCVSFYDETGNMIYSLEACHYTPASLGKVKEVTVP